MPGPVGRLIDAEQSVLTDAMQVVEELVQTPC